MKRRIRRAGVASATALLTAAAVFGSALVAHADTIADSIQASDAPLTLVAGSATTQGAGIRLIANSAGGGGGMGGDPDDGCNIDAGDAPLVLDIVTPAGVNANPDPLEITSCGVFFTVTFSAESGAESGTATATILSGPAGGGKYLNDVVIPIVVTQPQPTNTKPSVTVQGVSAQPYEIGSEPTPTCAVTDAEDGPSSFPAVVTGTLSHGLGTLTATCDYTDQGGLAADTATVTYSIVDTGAPTIGHTIDPATPNAAGWYKTEVDVTFDCADLGGSGIQSCTPKTTLGEGENQSVTGTAVDWAGNTATDTVTGINIDLTKPTVGFSGSFGSSHYFGEVPAAPTCDASDELSGLASACTVTGYSTAVGPHTLTATATDRAGNVATTTLSYTVLAWNLGGFYSPVDMGGTWNTVKGGSTVPLKFEVFAGAKEFTDTSVVDRFTATPTTCPGATAKIDDIEFTTTGGTALRYDATGGQFIQNWQTPKKPGACYTVTMTTDDGSSISANFMLK
ncbi:PxKF domain-containing protein [Agromyces sp. SYSU T00266]|uniref:PxKF domain-containing protein n=1 Tax=Agromyces zhanjiangensis TaxID=3158562 RepID=UPI00339690BB